MASKSLVIVESPAKAKTIEKYLGADFKVMASVGHVVDLPSSPLCVELEDKDHLFDLTYEVTKRDVINSLKEALKGASTLYLATDEDREGEAIAWHLLNQLKPKVPVKRMVFHEITKKAILEAVEHSRGIDDGLVDAQESRRTLDRLYGYELSPVLWRKVGPRLSAGRVQSPALRLIVERELERMQFRAASYWDLSARHATAPAFTSTLTAIDGRRIATGKDFSEQGALSSDARLLDEATATGLASGLEGRPFTVRSLEKKGYRSSPKPPFITSTMQQEGGRKLRLSAQQVMRLAQGLYERGYITYMRTDSTTLSATALSAARSQIGELYGDKFLPPQPRSWAKKAKNAQEAHEAIRPAGDAFRTPESLQGELGGGEWKLYDLIWKRTIASQMADAIGESVSVKFEASTAKGERCEFSAGGRTITFPGYLRAYVEGADDPDAALDDQESPLPALTEGQAVPVSALEPIGHVTSPPARFTEASLVKKLEELGIGRPSTYASIMGALASRYVWKKGQALVPDWVSFPVIRLLKEHFTELIDFAFTAEMEEDLDQVAGKERGRVEFLKLFYFGDAKHKGLKQLVEALGDIDAAAINSIPIGLGPTGLLIEARPGRFGPYLKHGEETASIPGHLAPDELTVEMALKILSAPTGGRELGTDPATGLEVRVKSGRFGPYVQLAAPPQPAAEKAAVVAAVKPAAAKAAGAKTAAKAAGAKEKTKAQAKAKPEKPLKTQSLLKSMDPGTVTLDEALQLLALPRTLGLSPEGDDVKACYGKFGPYLTKGGDSRNLGGEDDRICLTINLEQALAIFSQPKQFRGRGAPKPPLATYGEDPVSGKKVILKDGKFGLYVTDGETLASLRRGDQPEDMTPDRAHELLAERREYMASPEGQAKAALRAAKRGGRGAREVKGAAKSVKTATPEAKPAKAKKPKK
jgi:DNA topoisomerase-1